MTADVLDNMTRTHCLLDSIIFMSALTLKKLNISLLNKRNAMNQTQARSVKRQLHQPQATISVHNYFNLVKKCMERDSKSWPQIELNNEPIILNISPESNDFSSMTSNLVQIKAKTCPHLLRHLFKLVGITIPLSISIGGLIRTINKPLLNSKPFEVMGINLLILDARKWTLIVSLGWIRWVVKPSWADHVECPQGTEGTVILVLSSFNPIYCST